MSARNAILYAVEPGRTLAKQIGGQQDIVLGASFGPHPFRLEREDWISIQELGQYRTTPVVVGIVTILPGSTEWNVLWIRFGRRFIHEMRKGSRELHF